MASITDIPPGLESALTKKRRSIDIPPYMSTDDNSLRIIVFGITEPHQFSLTESVLQKPVFDGADPHAVLTTKTSGNVLERNVTAVNTPNLKDFDSLHDTFKKELKKAVCFSCPGPHAILFTLNLYDVPSNAYDIFKPVVQYFGEAVLNHTMIVVYHDEEDKSQTLEESVKKNKHFRTLIEKCGQRYLVFSGKRNRTENNMTRELFHKLDMIVEEHGVFNNIEYKDADKRIKKEEKILEKKRQKEVSNMLEALKMVHSGEDLEREVKLYKEKVRIENRDRAELLIADRIGFTLRVVDYMAAIGKGAAAGAALGCAIGLPSMVIGAVIGGALGGFFGGAAEAAWNVIARAFSGVREVA